MVAKREKGYDWWLKQLKAYGGKFGRTLVMDVEGSY